MRRRGGVVGQRGVERRRRHTFSGFGSADDDPVARRILHEVCGVAGRDHAELAGRLGEGGRGLGLEHVALERLLLLQQRLIGFPGAAQLVGPLGGVGRQPQRDTQPQPQRPDDQHHERDPGRQRAGLRSISEMRAMRRSLKCGRTTLGALALRAFARALAWLVFFGRTGLICGRVIGAVSLPRACVPRRGGASGDRRCVPRAGWRGVRRRSSAPRTGGGRLAFMSLSLLTFGNLFQCPKPHGRASWVEFDLGCPRALGAAGQAREFRLVPGEFDGQSGWVRDAVAAAKTFLTMRSSSDW